MTTPDGNLCPGCNPNQGDAIQQYIDADNAHRQNPPISIEQQLANAAAALLESQRHVRALETELAELKAAKPEPTVERLQAAWEAVAGSLPTWEWWRQLWFQGSANWDTMGELKVMGENPDDEAKTITKFLTARDFLAAYDAMPHKLHCGTCDLIDDPDECSGDLILQWAMYGQIVYG